MELGPIGSGIAGPALSYVLPTLACLFSSLRDNSGYNGYQVLRINATNQLAYKVLNNIFQNDNFDFWSPPSRITPTDVMVCPEQLENIKLLLGYLRIPYDIMVPNVATAIQIERVDLLRRQSISMNWDTYHRLSTIQDWMASMAGEHSFVSILTIGESSEKRPLQVMKISTGGVRSKKPAIWIDGGIHAREWVSPAVVTYMANELIKKTAQDPNYKLVDIFDWYIMPNVNPDGYEFSHTTDRMWRKTRSTLENNFFANLFKCKGADPNRNFEYKWGGKGTSNSPCSETYRGPKPASEPEIFNVQKFVYDNREQIKLFLTFHSYSQMLFLPWGYDNIRIPDYDELIVVANKAANSLEAVYGTKFQVGPSPELLYAAAGGSEDFAKGIANIKYSYCFELRDTGKHGFILPQEQILPSGIETFAAVKSMSEDMIQIYNLGVPAPPSDQTEDFVQPSQPKF